MSVESKSDLKRSEEELKQLISDYEEGSDYDSEEHEIAGRLIRILNRRPELCEQSSIHNTLVPHIPLLTALPELVKKVYNSFPLHCAVTHGAPFNLIQALVAHYPHSLTEKVGNNEETPLHLAASHRHDRAVFEVLATPEALRSPNRYGELPLFTYCEHHSVTNREDYDLELDLVRLLVELYPDSVYLSHGSDISPLHKACHYASHIDLPAIEFLETASRGGTFTRSDDRGRMYTPLHMACEKTASHEITHYLIQALPDHVRAVDWQKRTPLHHLCENYDLDRVPQIRELVEAYPESLALLDSSGNTPLHVVCQEADPSDIPMIEFLVKGYPEAQRVKNKRGYTPLHVACSTYSRYVEVIRFLAQECPKLLDSGIEEAAGNVTPLHIMAQKVDKNVPLKSYMEALGVSGEAAKVKDDKGQIPLHWAVEGYAWQNDPYWLAKYSENVECLLKVFPGGILSQDNDGKSPLEYACEKNADLSLIYQLISVNPIVTMGLESGRQQAPSSSRKRKRVSS